MELPLKSLAVANRFIEISNESGGKDLTLMKLLKVVYFAHGWHLGLTGKPLVNEYFQAWQFGPVAPDVYHAFKHVGASPINSPAYTFIDFNLGGSIDDMKFEAPTVPREPNMDVFLNKIWETYGRLSAFQLSELTHQTGTPWYKAWFDNGGSMRKNTPILDEDIREYFKNKIDAGKPEKKSV
jgi:uncharacterized phage-associated protein